MFAVDHQSDPPITHRVGILAPSSRLLKRLLVSDKNKYRTIELNSQMKIIVWQQFGAAIDMLENAITTCPQDLWGKHIGFKEFWYIAFHTLFFLDLYLSESDKDFTPPAPFTLDELDERGLLPDRIYTKEELLTYLTHGRKKCRKRISSITEEHANQRCGFHWLDISNAEILLYNMRHVQHHAAQLNFILCRKVDAAPRWVRKTGHGFD
jgi:hypothetical protein